MFFIQKKPPRPHQPGEPLLYHDHKRPVTRRDFLAAGMLGSSGVVMAPAWLAALLKCKSAEAQVALAADIQAMLGAGQCNVPTKASGIPFICFDLAGGANLVGSEVLVGQQGGQSNFLSTAGYELLGVPGNMVPGANNANIDPSLGLLWQADGAIKRGILSVATSPATAAGTSGAVLCAESQNDTQTNPHNPMYGIAMAGCNGLLLDLVGTVSSASGGNSMAPAALINPALQPTTINQPSDATGLVSTGGASSDPLSVAVVESQTRISGGNAPFVSGTEASIAGAMSAPSGSTPGVQFYSAATDSNYAVDDTTLKNQVRCNYAKSAYTGAAFGNPASLDPTQDPLIIGGASPIFTAAQINSNSDAAATATVMKLVIDGYAGAGTIAMGGFDYHDGTRATGETRNFQAGQMIGAVLEYAQRKGSPVMIYVISDGSLSSNMMPDNSTAGRGKLGWQGDNSSVASTFFLVYSPKGRPALANGTAGQQIGYFTAGGNVVTSSSIVGNAVTTLVQVVILNYMGLNGTVGQYSTIFNQPSMAIGTAAQMDALLAFSPIV
jgi:hypothetical protein